jgi:hypothetical protein
MVLENYSISAIREACNIEWNLFANKIAQIIEADEFQNIRTFCEAQLQLIDRTSSRMSSKQDIIGSRPSLQQSLKSLESALLSVRSALEAESLDILTLQRALKALSSQFQHSDPLLQLIASTDSELATVKKANIGFIDVMQQYITNAENGRVQRRSVKLSCQESFAEISAFFAQAEKEEKRIAAIAARPVPQNGDEPRTTPVRKLKKIPEPRHLAVTRPKLFEDRKLVSVRPGRRAVYHSKSAAFFIPPASVAEEPHDPVE